MLLALLMMGLGIAFFVIAVLGMAAAAFKRQLVWSLSWNALIFPTGTLVTSTSQIGVELDSPVARVITTLLTALMVFVFLLNFGMACFYIGQGKLLIVRTRIASHGQTTLEPKIN